jgi:putative membrane protein
VLTDVFDRRKQMNRVLVSLATLLFGVSALFSSDTWGAEVGKFTDAQIAAIVVTANQVDIDAGKLAMKTSTNDEVKAFAQRMVTDHTGVNKSATELVTKLGVTPEANAVSKQLQTEGNANIANLNKLKGAAFDKAYIDHEVVYHQSVLDSIDGTLIPNASNEELKELLVKARPAFVSHHEHAKALQEKLGKSGG